MNKKAKKREIYEKLLNGISKLVEDAENEIEKLG